MSIISALGTNITLSDGTNTLVKNTPAVSFTGTNESYTVPLTVGTSPVSVPLPASPAQLVQIRNMAPFGVAAPANAPTLVSVAGGTLTGTTYYVKVTYVNATGETLASSEASLAVATNFLLSVSAPPALGSATGYNVYVSTTTGAEQKQNSSPIPLGAAWILPTTGLVAGSSVPGSNTTSAVVTVSWTKQGGSSEPVIDLLPQAILAFCEPTSNGGFNGPSATGGVTAISLQSTIAGTPVDVVLGG